MDDEQWFVRNGRYTNIYTSGGYATSQFPFFANSLLAFGIVPQQPHNRRQLDTGMMTLVVQDRQVDQNAQA